MEHSSDLNETKKTTIQALRFGCQKEIENPRKEWTRKLRVFSFVFLRLVFLAYELFSLFRDCVPDCFLSGV
jgi:hypothetical protein